MKLEEFVEQTLMAITNGVFSAQSKSPSSIAPGLVEGVKMTTPQMISFEVAVATSKEGGGGINISSIIEAGGNMKSEYINKISFDVPVYFNAPNLKNTP